MTTNFPINKTISSLGGWTLEILAMKYILDITRNVFVQNNSFNSTRSSLLIFSSKNTNHVGAYL
jgi:hypothetical protein